MSDDVEVISWYTKARRFPKYIGTIGLRDERLPGGPYPVGTFVGVVGGFLFGAFTMRWWGMESLLSNFTVLALITSACGLCGHILVKADQNPLMYVSGLANVLRTAATSSTRERAETRSKTRLSRGTTPFVDIAGASARAVEHEAPPEPSPTEVPVEPSPSPSPSPAPAPVAAAPVPVKSPAPLTGVQAMLAGAGSDKK